MSKTPERRYIFECRIQGDTLEDVCQEMKMLLYQIETNQIDFAAQPGHGTMGGVTRSSTWSRWLNPDTTAESYQADLDAWVTADRNHAKAP